MGNLFCKQPSEPTFSNYDMVIDPTGTNFLHGSSTGLHPDVTDCRIWYPVTNKKLDKVRKKTMTKASVGEPTLHVSAPEGHIAAKSTKPHPSLYYKRSKQTLTTLVNKDQNLKLVKKYKNKSKPQKTHISNMNPNFDPDMLNMKDLKLFTQQLNHLLTLWEIKNKDKKTKKTMENTIPNTINTRNTQSKNKNKSPKNKKNQSSLTKLRLVTICAITGSIIHGLTPLLMGYL